MKLVNLPLIQGANTATLEMNLAHTPDFVGVLGVRPPPGVSPLENIQAIVATASHSAITVQLSSPPTQPGYFVTLLIES